MELLCAIAVLATLLMLAAPSFARLIQRLRIHQAVMELKGSVQLARSEAIRRGESIKLRKKDSAEDRNCGTSPADWSCGWVVFIDSDNNGTFNPTDSDGDELIQSFPSPVDASVRFTSNASILTVNRWGAINGVGAGFAVTPHYASDSPNDTVVCISAGGRVRSAPGNSCS